LWAGDTLIATAVINLLAAALTYSPIRPGPAPKVGFLLAEFAFSMFVSSGIWGVPAPIVSPDLAIRGVLVTGALLFVVLAALGFLVFG
jgi:hypothetical protein